MLKYYLISLNQLNQIIKIIKKRKERKTKRFNFSEICTVDGYTHHVLILLVCTGLRFSQCFEI